MSGFLWSPPCVLSKLILHYECNINATSPASWNHVCMDIYSRHKDSKFLYRQELEYSGSTGGLIPLYILVKHLLDMKTHIGMKSLTEEKEQAERGTCNCNYGALMVVISQGSSFPVSVYLILSLHRDLLALFCQPGRKGTSHYP